MRLNVELKKDLYDEFSERAIGEGRSISEVIRELVINWCAKKRREEIRLAEARREVKDGTS